MENKIFSENWNDEEKLRWFCLNAIDSAVRSSALSMERPNLKIEAPNLSYKEQNKLMQTQTELYHTSLQQNINNSVNALNALNPDDRAEKIIMYIFESRSNKNYINHFPNHISKKYQIDTINDLWDTHHLDFID